MPEPRILRVFPRRTAYTPDDELVRVGPPDLYDDGLIGAVDEVHVSCTFTWDRAKCKQLAADWSSFFSAGVPTYMGGPGATGPVMAFVPGLYVKPGVTFTSRGCPNRCPWCLVPEREGALRELPIAPGWIVQDNNLLACSERHFAAVCAMLAGQKRAANFKGGLESARLTAWHVEQIRRLRIEEAWLAADGPVLTWKFRWAVEALGWLGREKLRCYVLVGFRGETPTEAERRLEAVWQAGCLPQAQLYHGPEAGLRRGDPEWRALMRRWRPAAAKDIHRREPDLFSPRGSAGLRVSAVSPPSAADVVAAGWNPPEWFDRRYPKAARVKSVGELAVELVRAEFDAFYRRFMAEPVEFSLDVQRPEDNNGRLRSADYSASPCVADSFAKASESSEARERRRAGFAEQGADTPPDDNERQQPVASAPASTTSTMSTLSTSSTEAPDV